MLFLLFVLFFLFLFLLLLLLLLLLLFLFTLEESGFFLMVEDSVEMAAFTAVETICKISCRSVLENGPGLVSMSCCSALSFNVLLWPDDNVCIVRPHSCE